MDDRDKIGGIAGSRSGDIILLLNVERGFGVSNPGGEWPGWHGGPTIAESRVPFAFAHPEVSLVKFENKKEGKNDVDFIEAVLSQVIPGSLTARPKHFVDVIERIIQNTSPAQGGP